MSALFASDTDQNRHQSTPFYIYLYKSYELSDVDLFSLHFTKKKKENEFQDPIIGCGVYYNRRQSTYRLQRRTRSPSAGPTIETDDKTRQQIRYQNERENQLAQNRNVYIRRIIV